MIVDWNKETVRRDGYFQALLDVKNWFAMHSMSLKNNNKLLKSRKHHPTRRYPQQAFRSLRLFYRDGRRIIGHFLKVRSSKSIFSRHKADASHRVYGDVCAIRAKNFMRAWISNPFIAIVVTYRRM